MTVTLPGPFSHGDSLSASEINQYKTAIEDIDSRTDGKEYGVLQIQGDVVNVLTHNFRWGFYQDNGTIESMDGTNTHSLSNPATSDYFDLDSLDWLDYGELYIARDFDIWYEVEDPV